MEVLCLLPKALQRIRLNKTGKSRESDNDKRFEVST